MQKTGTSINPPPPEPGIVGGGGGCEGGWARPKKGGKKYNLTRYAIITWEIIRFSLTRYLNKAHFCALLMSNLLG